MIKTIKILVLILFFSLSAYSQDSSFVVYTYTIKQLHPSYYYCEKIKLFNDGTFVYYNENELIKKNIEGNWQVRNDSILVLDSRPQRSKLIVFETYKRSNKTTFLVRDIDDNHPITYCLYLITNQNDTIVFRDQFDKTYYSAHFSSFYIVNNAGLHSPTYKIRGRNTNFFEILFNQKRIFENESWKYCKQYIIPLGNNKEYVNYKLIKE